jgi:hypothetical protein
MTRCSSESSEQQGFIQWWKEKFPNILIFHVPNGGKRSIRTAIRLKNEGVVAGVPDLFCPEWKLWIELKRKHGGYLSQEQKAMISYLEKVGYTCIVGYGAEDASRKVLSFLSQKSK